MSYEEMFAEMQQKYLSSFEDKIKAIGNWQQENNYGEIQTLFHNMKGTGTTYGYPLLSALGQYVEELLNESRYHTPQMVLEIQGLLKETVESIKSGNPAKNLEGFSHFQKIQQLLN